MIVSAAADGLSDEGYPSSYVSSQAWELLGEYIIARNLSDFLDYTSVVREDYVSIGIVLT